MERGEKAYGDPGNLAKGPNVDLVICSTRVSKHLATVGPSLKAGKDVIVEWPLGKSLPDAKELLRLKKEGGEASCRQPSIKTAPLIKKLKELVDGESIGKVLNSSWMGQGGQQMESVTKGVEYLGIGEYRGNLITIRFGHQIDYFQQVIKVIDFPAGQQIGTFIKDTDDTIFLVGILSNGAPISYAFRGGKPFKRVPGIDWRIYGEKGEIKISADIPFISIFDGGIQVLVHDFETDEVIEVEIEKDGLGKLPMEARNVGRVYGAFRKGVDNCTFEDAMERVEFLDLLELENGHIVK
ncbi:uncharacterized protein PAC_10419 [Phialocephala subalpina]|uniref:Uncharacterized protein n=1 Tax=Phialocephala subalpina TaxID=576137 RepID=A0A1L7X675_9HELO|nr:uncharacterized protein PAC_10419 [Phialocephala subalpina]